MKVFIVHAHPEPQSFNGALTRHAQQAWAPWRSYATIRLWRHA